MLEVDEKVICWWSGGITSAVACKKAIEIFGKENCIVVFIDTKNEHDDTYRFKDDCAKWYGTEIESITEIGKKYSSIQDCWKRHKSLNLAKGAVCSDRLKTKARKSFQKKIKFSFQVFGFEFTKREFNRARSTSLNHGNAKPIFPLLMLGLSKEDCIRIVERAGIAVPEAYQLGFTNNNCLKTGCVQGGIGYWQKMQKDMPELFDNMAEMEHTLTELKKMPVTILKDQSKPAKWVGSAAIFLKKNKDYPNVKCLDDMAKRKVIPLIDCNGFCGTNDLNEVNPTEKELNYGVDTESE